MVKIISFWRFVISFGLAKSGTWATTVDKEQRIYLISLHILKRGETRTVNIIVGPISVIVGMVN